MRTPRSVLAACALAATLLNGSLAAPLVTGHERAEAAFVVSKCRPGVDADGNNIPDNIDRVIYQLNETAIRLLDSGNDRAVQRLFDASNRLAFRFACR